MGNISKLLEKRTAAKKKNSKMTEVAKRSSEGNLSSFSGVFSLVELSAREKEVIETILREHNHDKETISHDLKALLTITSEVKAITNQAVILHGERIKQAQTILKEYEDGAFTAWLMATYGNRQTPYNFLQYYEFYLKLPKKLISRLEQMPRQAVYVLASREGNKKKKEKIIENYKGETKEEILKCIRKTFPLDESDGRRAKFGDKALSFLNKLNDLFEDPRASLTVRQKRTILTKLNRLYDRIAGANSHS